MAKLRNVTTVKAPPVQAPAPKKSTGGKPVATSINLDGLAAALMALKAAGKANRGGREEMRLLDGRTYDELAEEIIAKAPGSMVVLVEGINFRMDAELKSIAARVRRALAGDNRDALHRLIGYHCTVGQIEAVKDFTYTTPDGKLAKENIPNTIVIDVNAGILTRQEEWEEAFGEPIAGLEGAEEGDEEGADDEA